MNSYKLFGVKKFLGKTKGLSAFEEVVVSVWVGSSTPFAKSGEFRHILLLLDRLMAAIDEKCPELVIRKRVVFN